MRFRGTWHTPVRLMTPSVFSYVLVRFFHGIFGLPVTARRAQDVYQARCAAWDGPGTSPPQDVGFIFSNFLNRGHSIVVKNTPQSRVFGERFERLTGVHDQE